MGREYRDGPAVPMRRTRISAGGLLALLLLLAAPAGPTTRLLGKTGPPNPVGTPPPVDVVGAQEQRQAAGTTGVLPFVRSG